MTNSNKQYKFDSVDLILYLWSNKIPLLILTALAAIISITVSLNIESKYKSEVFVFPVASSSVSLNLLSVNIREKEVLNLGEEEEVEQLLQILNSGEIKERIIKKYNLMNHYEIDSKGQFPYTKLYKEYRENIKFTPTKFMSVKIHVLDKNAQIAANIANDIAALVDTISHDMQRERALKAVTLVEREYNTLKNQIQVLEDSLTVMRHYGVIDYESQTRVLTEAYAKAIVDGNDIAARKLQSKLDILSKYGGAYVSIREYLKFEFEHLSNLKSKYAEAVVDATQTLPSIFIVNPAVASEKKSYPVRWLIVVVSTLSAFILSLLFLVIYDAIKKRLTEIKEQL